MTQHAAAHPDSRRRTWIVLIAALLVGLVLSGAMVWKASYSVFNSTTSNPSSNWSTGTIAISDNDSNVALFTVTKMKPGQTGSRCIQVTSTGTLPSSVKLYATQPPPAANGYSQTNGVGDYTSIVVSIGTQSTFAADCSGFTSSSTAVPSTTLTTFNSSYYDFAHGAGTWTPTGTATENMVYRFDYTFSATAPNTTQNGTATIGFTWEAQNT